MWCMQRKRRAEHVLINCRTFREEIISSIYYQNSKEMWLLNNQLEIVRASKKGFFYFCFVFCIILAFSAEFKKKPIKPWFNTRQHNRWRYAPWTLVFYPDENRRRTRRAASGCARSRCEIVRGLLSVTGRPPCPKR